MQMRPALFFVLLAGLAVAPAASAHGEPKPLQASTTAAPTSSVHLARSVYADGLVSGADFTIDLGHAAGGKVVYYDPATGLLFHDLRVSSVVWGTSSVQIRGLGLLNGKRVRFVAVAADGGEQSNGTFHLSWNGGPVHGGAVAEGSVTIS